VNSINTQTTLREVEAAARALGLKLQVFNASTSREIDAVFATFGRERPDALFVGQDAFFNSRRFQLANLAARQAIAMTSGSRDISGVGGLMSYGSNIPDVYRQMGVYTGRVLKGEKPGGHAGRAVDEVRAGHQSPDRQDAWSHRARQAARGRRRGH